MSQQSFVQLPADRRRLCNETQATLGLHVASVEKDFWVCWTLRELFQLTSMSHIRQDCLGLELEMGKAMETLYLLVLLVF